MPDLSRRRLIQTGLAGSAVLLLGGGALAWFGGSYPVFPGDVPIGLSPKQLAVARALVEAIVPGQGGMPSGVSLGIHQRMDEQAWAAEPAVAGDLRAAFELLEHVPPLLGRYGRFTKLDPETRAEVFSRMLASRRDLLAQIAVSLKQMVHLLYYAHEAVWPAISYDGPWIQKASPPDSALAYQKLLAERGARAA